MDNWLDAAIEREATPKALREDTVAQFAAKWGITSDKYNYEMGKEENWKKVLEISLRVAKKAVPEIVQKLTEKATIGDLKAIEMIMDKIYKLANNIDLKTDGKPITPIYGGQAIKTVQGLSGNQTDIPTD